MNKAKIQENHTLEFITGVTELEDDVLEAVTGGLASAGCTNGGGCGNGAGCDCGASCPCHGCNCGCGGEILELGVA